MDKSNWSIHHYKPVEAIVGALTKESQVVQPNLASLTSAVLRSKPTYRFDPPPLHSLWAARSHCTAPQQKWSALSAPPDSRKSRQEGRPKNGGSNHPTTWQLKLSTFKRTKLFCWESPVFEEMNVNILLPFSWAVQREDQTRKGGAASNRSPTIDASGAITVSSFESAIPSCKSEPKFSTGLDQGHTGQMCHVVYSKYWQTIMVVAITCCNLACAEHSPNLAVHWSTLVEQSNRWDLPKAIKCRKLSPPPKQDLFHRKSS